MIERKISFSHLDLNLKNLKLKMNKNLHAFRLEREQLKMLKFNDDHEQKRNVFFIKGAGDPRQIQLCL